MGSLYMSHNQNGISIHFSSQNSNQNFLSNWIPDLQPEHQLVREHGRELHEQTAVPAPHVSEPDFSLAGLEVGVELLPVHVRRGERVVEAVVGDRVRVGAL